MELIAELALAALGSQPSSLPGTGWSSWSHFLEMGLRFCETAERPVFHEPDEHVSQNVHWGLELVLKAYLHAQGWTDARCIADVRHDIALSLAACEEEGLEGIDYDTRALLAALSPFSRRHGVAEFLSSGAGGYTAAQAIIAGQQICSAVILALSEEP